MISIRRCQPNNKSKDVGGRTAKNLIPQREGTAPDDTGVEAVEMRVELHPARRVFVGPDAAERGARAGFEDDDFEVVRDAVPASPGGVSLALALAREWKDARSGRDPGQAFVDSDREG